MDYDTRVDFKGLRLRTLKKYVKVHDVAVKQFATPTELCDTVQTHFKAQLMIDEEETLSTFLDKVALLRGIDIASLRRHRMTSAVEESEEQEYENESHSQEQQRPTTKSKSRSKTQTSGSTKRKSSSTSEKSRKRKRSEKTKLKIMEGRQVAANVDGNWILAKVCKYQSRMKLYEVEDVDEDDVDKSKKRHLVPAFSVLPLANPEEDEVLEFHRGDRVLALFPGTTSFYAANVNSASLNDNGEMSVRFDDDEDEDGKIVKKREIPAFLVVHHP
eukprot:g962.t1